LAEEGRYFDTDRLGNSVWSSVIAGHASEKAGRSIDDAALRVGFDETIDGLEH
jgi:hypothetical protein